MSHSRVYFSRAPHKQIRVSLLKESRLFPEEAPLYECLNAFSATQLYTDDTLRIRVHERTRLSMALQPGRYFQKGEQAFCLSQSTNFLAVENWLHSIEMAHLVPLFRSQRVDNLFFFGFLCAKDLQQMNVPNEDRQKLLSHLEILRSQPEEEFRQFCFAMQNGHAVGNAKDQLSHTEAIKMREDISSVEDILAWLEEHELVVLSTRFLCHNCPYYMLPWITPFMLFEMGILRPGLVIEKLKELQNTAAFRIKALAYWLCDIDLGKYIFKFANSHLRELSFEESLAALGTPLVMEELIPAPEDRQRLLVDLQDIDGWLSYTAVTETLVDDLMMEKYEDIFCQHGIEFLLGLTNQELSSLGISSAKDRKQILGGVEKLKRSIPPSSLEQFLATGKTRRGAHVQ